MYKIKTLLLCFGLIAVGEVQSYRDCYIVRDSCYVVKRSSGFEQKVGRVAAYTLSGLAVLYVGTYLYGRESNASVAQSVDELYKSVDVLCQRESVSVDSLVVLSRQIFGDSPHFIFKLKQSLQNRYGCWVKPWNWSYDMQQAYEKIRLVELLYGYVALLEKSNDLKSQDVLQFSREQFSSMSKYPSIFCFEAMLNDVAYGYEILIKADIRLAPLLKDILSVLEKAGKLLQADKEYLEEVRAKKNHDLQEAQLLAMYCRR